MTNPVEAERRFLALQQRLSNYLSYRQQWLEIGDFLTLIEGHYTTYDTHCEQLSEQMPVFSHPLSVTGTDPARFGEILGLLDTLTESLPALGKSDNFGRAHESLLTATAFLYLCLQEYPKAGRLLFGDQSEVTAEAAGIGDYLARAKSQVGGNRGTQTDHRVQQLRSWWKKIQHHSQPALLVPVVETASKDIGEGEGRLRELRVTVLGEREADDHFRSNYSVAGAEGEDAGIFPEVIQATRHVLSESHPELQQRYFTLQFEYALPLGMHIGRSSELACSLLAYSAILDAVNSRERFIPKQGVAVTGRLEEASRVAPVSTEGIPAKTRAAFFSWADTLVVPEQQKPRFLEQLAILQEQYPSRKLTLIGLEEPKAFFYDRRISNHRLDSKTKHLAKKAWKQKFSVAGIATILVLLAVIGRLWYGPVDRNPQQAVFEGEFMTIQNAQNNPIKRFKVGEYTSTLVNSSGPGAVKNMAAFVDVTGDGLNEVIWGAFENGKEQTMQLNLYDLAGDSLIWSRPLSFDLFFPQNSDVIENRYSVREIEMLEQPDGSIDFILLLRHMPFFPSLIVHLDAGTGSIINEYVHIGHLIDVELHDIDNDQEQEIISVGLNNAYDLACMTVLEVDSLKGHSPLKGTYTIGNYSRADEISYVLFPRSVVSMALSKRINNNTATAINVNTEDKNIEVQVYEVFLNDASPYEARQGRLMYFFDYKMNLKSIGSTTQYDLWAKNLYRDGRIPKVDYEYLEAFKDSLVYLVRK